jgi:predicted RNase H-like HicB family nuclease
MKIPVLIEPMNDNGFRASGLALEGLIAEGRTDSEALQNFRKAIEARIRAGRGSLYLTCQRRKRVSRLQPGY